MTKHVKHNNFGRTRWIPIDRKPWQAGLYELKQAGGGIYWRLVYFYDEWYCATELIGATHWRGLTRKAYRAATAAAS